MLNHSDALEALSAGAIMQYLKDKETTRGELRDYAEKLATYYPNGSLKIEINFSRERVAKLNITEYDVD